jgi:hypothetical protein
VSALLGLSAADSALYTDSLNTDCEIAYQIHNLDLSHQLVASIEPVLLDGQLDYTGGDTDTVTQMCTLNFLDPDRTLRLDGTNPGAGVGGLDRLIQVKSYVRSELTDGRWIGAYAFTGRPSRVGRAGDTINLVAESKECLHLRGVDRAYVEKGSWVITAIKWILQKGGETRFRFPGVAAFGKLPKRIYYGGPDEAMQPWKVAWKLARGIGLQLFFDKTGFACLRKIPQSPMWTVREQTTRDGRANALSPINSDTDLTTLRNRVITRGMTTPPAAKKGQPAQEAKPVVGGWTAPWTERNSPSALMQNGVPWSNTAEYDESTVHTKAQADAFSQARGGELLTLQTGVQTTILPLWHADPMDLFRILANNGADFLIRLLDGTAPIGPTDGNTGMTVGYNQKVRKATAGRLR